VATVKYGAKDIMRDNFASKTVISMFSHLIIKHNFEDDVVMHLMQVSSVFCYAFCVKSGFIFPHL